MLIVPTLGGTAEARPSAAKAVASMRFVTATIVDVLLEVRARQSGGVETGLESGHSLGRRLPGYSV
jgi:hypothetical protein